MTTMDVNSDEADGEDTLYTHAVPTLSPSSVNTVYAVVPTHYNSVDSDEHYYADGYELPIALFESKVKADIFCLNEIFKFLADFSDEDDTERNEEDEDETSIALQYFRYMFDNMRWVHDPFDKDEIKKILEIRSASEKDKKLAYGLFKDFLFSLNDWKAEKFLQMISITPFTVVKLFCY